MAPSASLVSPWSSRRPAAALANGFDRGLRWPASFTPGATACRCSSDHVHRMAGLSQAVPGGAAKLGIVFSEQDARIGDVDKVNTGPSRMVGGTCQEARPDSAHINES